MFALHEKQRRVLTDALGEALASLVSCVGSQGAALAGRLTSQVLIEASAAEGALLILGGKGPGWAVDCIRAY